MDAIAEKLTLVKTSEYTGYYYDELEKYFREKGGDAMAERFGKFMDGQTMGAQDGRGVVYIWDLERFVTNKRTSLAEWD